MGFIWGGIIPTVSIAFGLITKSVILGDIWWLLDGQTQRHTYDIGILI
jgi:hypothetical protein